MRTMTMLLAACLILTVSVEAGGQGKGGGKVENVAPEVMEFACEGQVNDGDSVVFSGVVRDGNGEQDIKQIKVSDGETSYTKTVTNGDLDDKGQPDSLEEAGDWAIRDQQAQDGKIAFDVMHVYPAGEAALHSWRVEVSDGGDFQFDADLDCTDDVRIRVTLDDAPVGGDGSPVDANWGGWSADPGELNVQATNFIRLKNTGYDEGQEAVVDFTDAAFTGTDIVDYSIPIDHNIRFAWEEVLPETAPSTMEFSGASSADGTVEVAFTEQGNWIYVYYEIVEMPDILADQQYTASFTVTPV